MPEVADFSLSRYEDGVLTVELRPPSPVGGRPYQFCLAKRYGSDSPILTRDLVSGYSGASGMSVVSSGQGIIQVSLIGALSGLEFGNYAYWVDALTSGNRARVTKGYITHRP